VSDLIVIGYPDEETAGKVWDELVKLQEDAGRWVTGSRRAPAGRLAWAGQHGGTGPSW
jgi:hypothetical protein